MEFMWERTRMYFLTRLFLPFAVLNLLPVILLPYTLSCLEHDDDFSPLMSALHTILLIMLVVGNVRSLIYEVKECLNKENYFIDWINYFQLSLILSTTFVTFTAIHVEYWRFKMIFAPDGSTVGDLASEKKNFHTAVVITLIMMMIELPQQLRMFDYFAPFVRSMTVIIQESA